MNKALKATLKSNLLWFAGSLVVAIMVWFIAKIEANPIDERDFTRPISVIVDENMIITDRSSETARIFISAQESTLARLRSDDITVSVDLRGRPPGEYTVPLNVDISRPASSDTQPTQITVEIEQRVSQQVPVEITVENVLVNFAADLPERDLFQALVSGATDDVMRVSKVVGIVDLSAQDATGTIERTVTFEAQDADGNRVTGVNIEPASDVVTVEVTQREDVRTYTVRPNIDFESLPDNFVFNDVDYEPNFVTLNGSPDVLESLGDTIDTLPIDLSDRRSNFSIDVALDLPDRSNLIILGDSSTIQVDIFISEEAATLQLDDIPVRLIGTDENANLMVTVNPTSLSVVLTGPASDIEMISPDDVQAIVDISGLTEGTTTVVPRIEIGQGQTALDSTNQTLFPAEVSVVITAPQPEVTQAPEATAELQPTATDD